MSLHRGTFGMLCDFDTENNKDFEFDFQINPFRTKSYNERASLYLELCWRNFKTHFAIQAYRNVIDILTGSIIDKYFTLKLYCMTNYGWLVAEMIHRMLPIMGYYTHKVPFYRATINPLSSTERCWNPSPVLYTVI